MNNYRLQVKNYRAISNADIEINGITVLTGENGSGKSTITKLVLVLIECISNYEYYLIEEFKELVRFKATEFSVLRREITRSMNDGVNLSAKFKEKLNALHRVGDVDEVRSIYFDMVTQTASILVDRFNDLDEDRYKRLLNFLEMNESDKFTYDVFVEHHMNEFDFPLKQLKKSYDNPSIDNIWNIVKEHGWDNIVGVKDLKFFEDSVTIVDSINDTFEQLLGVENVIYVDTPLILSHPSYYAERYGLWGLLNSSLFKEKDVKLDVKARKMLLRIQHIINGSIYLENPDTDEEEFHYIRQEDGLKISIKETATGLKSFAYILRFLANGTLNNRTLLILDEPEVHLHPQWIVEFARIIVLLNKELGVRVLLTSHNPDMVSAIQAIAKKEQVEKGLLYYIAENEPNSQQYSYKNLGIDISEIFQTFNIALTRINDYGRMDY